MLFAIKINNKKKKQRIESKQGGVGANLACEGHRIPHTVSREGSLNQCNKKILQIIIDFSHWFIHQSCTV